MAVAVRAFAYDRCKGDRRGLPAPREVGRVQNALLAVLRIGARLASAAFEGWVHIDISDPQRPGRHVPVTPAEEGGAR